MFSNGGRSSRRRRPNSWRNSWRNSWFGVLTHHFQTPKEPVGIIKSSAASISCLRSGGSDGLVADSENWSHAATFSTADDARPRCWGNVWFQSISLRFNGALRLEITWCCCVIFLQLFSLWGMFGQLIGWRDGLTRWASGDWLMQRRRCHDDCSLQGRQIRGNAFPLAELPCQIRLRLNWSPAIEFHQANTNQYEINLVPFAPCRGVKCCPARICVRNLGCSPTDGYWIQIPGASTVSHSQRPTIWSNWHRWCCSWRAWPPNNNNNNNPNLKQSQNHATLCASANLSTNGRERTTGQLMSDDHFEWPVSGWRWCQSASESVPLTWPTDGDHVAWKWPPFRLDWSGWDLPGRGRPAVMAPTVVTQHWMVAAVFEG